MSAPDRAEWLARQMLADELKATGSASLRDFAEVWDEEKGVFLLYAETALRLLLNPVTDEKTTKG